MIVRIIFAVVLTGVLGAPAGAEPCNPVIDGTYCAVRRDNASRSSGTMVSPIQGIARDIGPWTDQPATLGGITFRGTETCMGLFRRGICN